MSKNEIRIDNLDIRIAVAVAICIITSRVFPIIQYMPACFAAILCMQDNVKISWKTGITRIIVTAIGGMVGIFIVMINSVIDNTFIFVALALLGILLTILICKNFKVPYIASRIACITFVIVIMVSSGYNSISYSLLRLLGTFYGVGISIILTVIFNKIYLQEKVRKKYPIIEN